MVASNPFNTLTPDIIDGKFDKLVNAARSGSSVDELLVLVRDFALHCPFQPITWNGAQEPLYLHRVRNYGTKPKSDGADGLWHPRPEIATQGRCNRKGQSILYLSRQMNTACQEVELSPGDCYTLTRFKLKTSETLNLASVGLINYPDEPLLPSVGRTLTSDVLNTIGLDAQGIENTAAVYRLLGNLFMQEAATERDYHLTTAITEFFTTHDGFDGILFPSVQDSSQYNVAIKPDAARKKLEIARAWTIRKGDSDTWGMMMTWVPAEMGEVLWWRRGTPDDESYLTTRTD